MKPKNDFARVSLAERLIVSDGRPSGFDYMRLVLAISVALVHSWGLMDHGPTAAGGLKVNPLPGMSLPGLAAPILAMFFALSGFLVAGSMERSKTLLTFLGLRVIRIVPALAVEVLLSAFLIGTVVTTLPLASYFQDPLFWKYLRNLVGDIQYFLPGVFENNPVARIVNGALWTVPAELVCYLTLAGLVLLGGAAQRKFLVPLATAGLVLAHLVLLSDKSLKGGVFSWPLLVFCFLTGVSLFLYRDKIVWSFPLFLGALTASIALFWFVPLGYYFAILTITYVTVYVGLTNFKRISVIKGADYSYGIYIYHFVIIQFFIYLAAPPYWWDNVLVCIPLSALFAACSWHFIEKPTQKWRKYLPTAEKRYLAIKCQIFKKLAGRNKLARDGDSAIE
jgi:peptidoglycan/LPS O-acetylase OafA/YrhL